MMSVMAKCFVASADFNRAQFLENLITIIMIKVYFYPYGESPGLVVKGGD